MDLAKKILGRMLKKTPSGLSLNKAFNFQAIVKGTKKKIGLGGRLNGIHIYLKK